MAEKFEDKRINEALDLLNELAKEKKAELQGMVSEKYSHLKSVLEGASGRMGEEVRDTIAHGEETVMGRRITIDSATMLNKGLEIIEACRLFDVTAAQVRVTVHPQSTVHSLVEYVDGSILAQISVTDMRLPILYALAYPERPASTLTFNLAALSHLDFEPPDFERFPCLRLAFDAAEKGGAHCIALNAADEVAVEAFLDRRIPFTGIPRTIERVLASTPEAHPATIAEVLAADREARETARALLA